MILVTNTESASPYNALSSLKALLLLAFYLFELTSRRFIFVLFWLFICGSFASMGGEPHVYPNDFQGLKLI